MDVRLRTFIDRLHAFAPRVRRANEYDADQLVAWARELEQFPSVESVPHGEWDEHGKHLQFYGDLPSELDREREALLSFVRVESAAALDRPHKTDL